MAAMVRRDLDPSETIRAAELVRIVGAGLRRREWSVLPDFVRTGIQLAGLRAQAASVS